MSVVSYPFGVAVVRCMCVCLYVLWLVSNWFGFPNSNFSLSCRHVTTFFISFVVDGAFIGR